jgi:uncharacterized protein (DUF1330 family)
MAAYLISDITVRDRAAFEVYRTRAADAIRSYGGQYLARLGEVQVLEGSWNPNTIVVVEFPSLEQARAWYRSTELRIRPRGARQSAQPQSHSR